MKTSWVRKHRGAFWERHVYGILAEIDLTTAMLLPNEAAENIEITVFSGQRAIPGKFCPLKFTLPLFPH
jgi:hypothetical protein